MDPGVAKLWRQLHQGPLWREGDKLQVRVDSSNVPRHLRRKVREGVEQLLEAEARKPIGWVCGAALALQACLQGRHVQGTRPQVVHLAPRPAQPAR
jgi:hypothetical protein